MKKLFILFALVPLLGFSQAKFNQEEFMYMHRSADSTNEQAFCRACWDAMLTAYGTYTSLSDFRVYADSVVIYLNTRDTSGCFTIYNQYGSLESDTKAVLWSHVVGTKLMYNLRQYVLTPSTRRDPIKQDFIRYCSGHVYIRHFR
jgi:myosin-crossreactive antigen